MILTPAYGRDYKSKKAVQADWDADKDFIIADFGRDMGRYINRQDAIAAGLGRLMVRYQRLTKIMPIKVTS